MQSTVKALCVGLVATSGLYAGMASAEIKNYEDFTAFATEKGYICTTCHVAKEADKTAAHVGPAYETVAAKRKAEAGAKDALIAKIKNGAMTDMAYGAVPMPPNATVTDEDAGVMVDWILSLGADAKADSMAGMDGMKAEEKK
jgi:cytochrome c